ncbi:MAG: hypothetical protein JWL88_179 [Parcubacteria group bacterium]|nr:hypothetical protein [Parcubacteria group bacterium]
MSFKSALVALITISMIATPTIASAKGAAAIEPNSAYYLGENAPDSMPRPTSLPDDSAKLWRCDTDQDGKWKSFSCKYVYKDLPAPASAQVSSASGTTAIQGPACNLVNNEGIYLCPSPPRDTIRYVLINGTSDMYWDQQHGGIIPSYLRDWAVSESPARHTGHSGSTLLGALAVAVLVGVALGTDDHRHYGYGRYYQAPNVCSRHGDYIRNGGHPNCW